MINKLIFALVLLCSINNSLLAQNFQKEYFQFTDFPFIDEMRHADFNGDGLSDFLIVASNFGKLQVGLNTGVTAPNFNEITDITSIQKTMVVDIDSDGDIDIIGLRQFSGVFVFINDGNAVFESQQLDLGGYASLDFADVTGDGSLEMIVGSFDLRFYQINATTWELTEIYSNDLGIGEIGALSLLDYENDGDFDLVISTESDGLFLLEQTANLIFESTLLYPDNYDVDNITIANLTNDEMIDFVLYGKDDQHAKIIVSDLNGEYSEESITMDGVNNTLTLVGDFNNDDKEEIISFENTTFNDPAMYIKQYNSSLTDLEIVQDHFGSFGGGVTDIDNDGDKDFYFFQNDISSPGLTFYLNEGVSSTHELANSTINIYPNPATDILNITVEGQLDFHSTLYNLEGRLIKAYKNTEHLEIESIPNGTYLLEIKDQKTGDKIIEKIIIGK